MATPGANSAGSADNVVQAQNFHGDVHFHGSGGEHRPPRQLPATVRHFINRTVEQDALTTLLNGTGSDDTVLVSTIDGLAGVGKSALVVQWAHQVRDRFPDGELYVDLRGFNPVADPMSPAEALAGFLTALGVPADSLPSTADARAAQFRSLVHGRRMLIVLDNARDAEQVLPLLPGSAGCLVVVTSRQRLDALVAQHGAQRLALTTLTGDEGHRLLARHLGAERLESEPEPAGELLDTCAGLPLALTLVAVQAAAEPDVPLADLAAELRDERDRLDALDAGGKTGVRAVFSWSYRTLSAPAARLFRLVGLPNSPDIGLAAAAALAGTDQRSTRRVLAELCRAHLLTRRAGERYTVHDLLRAYARECASADETEQERHAALQRLLDHYLHTAYAGNALTVRVLPELDTAPERSFADYDEFLEWWDGEHANVTAVVRQTAALDFPSSPWLAHAVAFPFKLRGLLGAMKSVSTAGLHCARRLGDRPLQARLLADLADAHSFSADYESAAAHWLAAKELFDELGDDLWLYSVQAALAGALTRTGRYAEAVESGRHALHVERTRPDLIPAKGHPDANLGLALAHLGRFDEAFEHLHRSLEHDSDRFLRGIALTCLGTAHFLAGQVDAAVEVFRRAVEHRRGMGNALGTATALAELGKALRARGDRDEARQAWEEALAVLERLDHPDAEAVRAHLTDLDGSSG